ncbi:MAG TPA: MMPL family transporter [Nocardioidaceae bacterium]|nr:MMPL family transporter [Nocardioidaceae bacterium]
MSSLLYALGKWCYRRWRVVVAVWMIVLVSVGTAAGLLGTGIRDVFTVPGEEAFVAADRLSHTFPEISGAMGQVVIVAQDGGDVTSPGHKAEIQAFVKELEDLDQVALVMGPWHEYLDVDDTINADRSAAMVQVQMSVPLEQVLPATKEKFEAMADAASDADLSFHAGGAAYGPVPPAISYVEGIGVIVALVVLLITFGSFIAAGLPLAIAGVGISITMATIWMVTRWIDISTTGPFLALMIGLAVGIDYSLFILARHRDEMGDGVAPEEATGRAVATAGSAVVFAGMTVIIALLGLAVTGLPFLAIMGAGSALSVLIAIIAALTLTPASFGILKHRLAPKPAQEKKPKKQGRVSLNERWLNLVLRFPRFFTVAVSGVLVVMTIPALHMTLTLPDNSTAHEGLTQRTTYELIEKEFGEGYTAQIVMTADIVQSVTPLEAIEDIKQTVLDDPGVRSVPLATPNPPNADTMILQIIPKTGPNDPATHELIDRIRALAPEIKDEWGFDIQLTGLTPASRDLTERLGKALLPFGILVLGLSLLLFTMVFRSIAIPIKATVNFVLSLGATFGAVVFVYQDGHFEHLLHTVAVSPIVCFLPVMLTSLLFGLSMDYEVFLVSRIREEYVHGASATDAIRAGFLSSSRVITAAAVIMIAVFAAFVPHGDVNTQPTAFALAIGVFIDAFMVRITLVPAVMKLLGDKAWWMPTWLDKHLPSIDVEGEGVTHQLELAQWPYAGAHTGVHADRIRLTSKDGDGIFGPVSFAVEPGSLLLVRGLSAPTRSALAYSLTGRMNLTEGKLKVAGQVVPQQNIMLRPYVALVRVEEHADPRRAIAAEITDRTRVLVVDGLDLVPSVPYRDTVVAEVLEHVRRHDLAAVITLSREAVETLATTDTSVRVLDLHTSLVAPAGEPATEGALA